MECDDTIYTNAAWFITGLFMHEIYSAIIRLIYLSSIWLWLIDGLNQAERPECMEDTACWWFCRRSQLACCYSTRCAQVTITDRWCFDVLIHTTEQAYTQTHTPQTHTPIHTQTHTLVLTACNSSTFNLLTYGTLKLCYFSQTPSSMHFSLLLHISLYCLLSQYLPVIDSLFCSILGNLSVSFADRLP